MICNTGCIYCLYYHINSSTLWLLLCDCAIQVVCDAMCHRRHDTHAKMTNVAWGGGGTVQGVMG